MTVKEQKGNNRNNIIQNDLQMCKVKSLETVEIGEKIGTKTNIIEKEKREKIIIGRSQQKRTKSLNFMFSFRIINIIIIIFCLLLGLFGNVVKAELGFVPTNVAQLSLYQTAQLRFESNTLVGDPPIIVGDKFYFILDSPDITCNTTGSGNTENNFNITSATTGGVTGLSTISVRNNIFTVGSSYIICYITNGNVYRVRRRPIAGSPITSTSLLVWETIYNNFNMQPTTASGGQGLVNLTIQQLEVINRPINQGLGSGNNIFLIPCNPPTTEGGIICSGINNLPEICATLPLNRIQLSNLRGVGSLSVTGSFTVPYIPNDNGYFICAPYCFDSNVNCGSASVQMSYTVVTPTNNNFILTFTEANPATYIVTPVSPQAREQGYIILTGTGLNVNDNIRIIRAGDLCASPTASLLSNIIIGSVVLMSETSVNVSFIAPDIITSQMRGRVCYQRAGTNLWSPVYKTITSQISDFTIDILQPTTFSVVPASPIIGQPISIFFTGTGLNSNTDDAFLTSNNNICNPDATSDINFQCTLIGATAPQCNVLVDPPTNQGLTLQICYRKEGRLNYAMIKGNIITQNRNPIYTISPYPLYAGQKATITFIGQGLSLADTVNFISSDETCGTGTPLTTFNIANGVEITSGTNYQYDAVGTGGQCLQVCYRMSNSAIWSVARPREMKSIKEDCPGQNLFISNYDLRFSLPFSEITAKETVALTLTSGAIPSLIKLVRADDSCAAKFCIINSITTTACEIAQNNADFTSSINGGGGAIIFAALASTSYILCGLNGGDTYIPILRLGSAPASTSFAFQTSTENPIIESFAPARWRVGLAYLNTTFSGISLNSSTDMVRAFPASALLSSTAFVCPPPTSISPTQLIANLLISESTTSTTAVYTRSDRMFTGDRVHICYIWGGGNRITYTGVLTFSERVPSQLITSAAPIGGYRAGTPITFEFNSNTTALQPTTDQLYFFRYPLTSNPNPNCYCGASCLPTARVAYDDVSLTAGATAFNVIWMRPRGFNNYDYSAIYILCYDTISSGSVTYMGRLLVNMSQPTYYTVTNAGNNVVGYPITIEAVQHCLGASCQILSIEDAMRVVPVATECYQLNDESLPAGIAENISEATSTGIRYTQRVVVNTAGNYRICYRIGGIYQELPYSTSYDLTPLNIGEADPISFTVIPAAPSSGQFITIQLQCSATICSRCVNVWLVPGIGASCWENIKGTFSSDNCLKLTRVQFPNEYLPQGNFTTCYGSNMLNNRRVPGTLEVAVANPSSFTSSSTNIFVNQDSDVTITITGTGLTTNDQIFLLTSIGFTCHDLRTNELQSNSTLSNWFAPSVNPNVLTIDSTGTSATWIVSNRDKRFGVGLVSDPTLCDNPGISCTMQLCYARSGATWAPVNILQLPNIQLFPSDPSSASFDHYPLAVGMYSSVTVVGRGLQVTDVLTVRKVNCLGDAITIRIGTPTVNEEGTEWIGVVRFILNDSVNYAVCYTRGTSTTEIESVDAAGQSPISILSSLYYRYDNTNITDNHEMEQYELLFVGAEFAAGFPLEVQSVDLITSDTECNYMPYYTSTGKDPEFDVTLNFLRLTTKYFGGRLNIPAGEYALCIQVTTGFFKVTSRISGNILTVGTANPPLYTATPSVPFPGQLFNLNFQLTSGTVGDNELLQIIDGTLYDCGNHNTTIVGEFPLVAVENNNTQAQVTGIILSEDYLGKMLTVCYKRTGGTFATVSRNELIDRNLRIMRQIPSAWSTLPTQPQSQRALQITFTGNAENPNYLQTTDRAFLIQVPEDGAIPTCDAAETISGNSVVMVGVNTMWSIASDQTIVGRYIVCYISTSNGAPVRVANPEFLTISTIQSPKGIFKNDNVAANVFSGERFYLMFDTDVVLDPVLSFDTNADSKDAVLFSLQKDCSSPLTAESVSIIPEEFQFKAMEVTNPSGIIVPYLHIVMRVTPGNYIVCMRRTGRIEGEAFFTYEAIGDLASPATLIVTNSPITQYVTIPTSPRAWVPSIEVTPTYSTGYTIGNFTQLFFIASTAGGAANNNIINDCYRPTSTEAITGEGIVILNTKLQVNLTTIQTVYPFPNAGLFQLCLQLLQTGQYTASVQSTPLTIINPSPTSYTVPDVLSISQTFTMAFNALDAIFDPSITGNTANIFVAEDNIVSGQITPDCINGQVPTGGGVTSFNTFTVVNNTYATVQANIMQKGYFYVCFLVQGQTLSFPVPNLEGGFVFSVGLTGAQSYVISPSPAYMGQQIEITILGNVLSSLDHVKLVDVTNLEEGIDYTSSCTENAANVDAEETNGIIGSIVNAISTTKAIYIPRINQTGRFILCYQSARLQNSWIWVSNLHDFNVGTPHPTAYVLQPTPSYATEIGILIIKDSSETNLLSTQDSVKLVDRGTGNAGFDCSVSTTASQSIGVITRIENESNSTIAIYQICAGAAVSVTLCYSLMNNNAWAEVPFQLPPPTYIFNPLIFNTNPFTGPTMIPTSPRPYEPFELTFTSSNVDIEITFINFAVSPQPTCTINPPYVTPVFYEKSTSEVNKFSIVLKNSGTYQIYLGTRTLETDPRILHTETITLSPCDPCGFTPSYTFIGNNATINFVSTTGDSFSLTDSIRIIPMSQGTSGRPCDAPTGVFESLTITPNTDSSTSASTNFIFFTGDSDEYLGDYYICYKKNAIESNYAIVSDNNGNPVTLSIYPVLPTQVVICPANPSFLETVTFSFTFSSTDYPKLEFSNQDNFILLPSSAVSPTITCNTAESSSITGIIRPVLDNVQEKNIALWVATLPHGHIVTSYQLCFRFAVDTISREISQTSLEIAAQNPSSVITEPAVITPESESFKIFIKGTELLEADNVYIVDGSQSCNERCGVTITPTELPSAIYTKQFINSSFVELDFTSSLGDNIAMSVCYRRVDNLLVRLALYYIGEPNPTSYNTSFVPRIGTRPLLTFIGVDLKSTDRMMIIETGMYCDESLALAIGVFSNVDSENGLWSSFTLALTGNSITARAYSVCYFVSGTAGYALMTEPLTVSSGGPNSFTTSNIPMRGRAMILTFTDSNFITSTGDEVIIACAGCSCFDATPAIFPYGVSQFTVTSNAEIISLRFGIEEIADYAVCYKIVDSGFAQVGVNFIHPVTNAPAIMTVIPIPTLQGQRLTFNLTNYASEGSTTGVPRETDRAMLVLATRLCWETETINAENIFSTPSLVTNVTSTQSLWLGHVPSLGPNAIPLSTFPTNIALCYREGIQEEYVVVPFPIVDGFTMNPANPASFVTTPTSVSTGLMDITMTFPNPLEGDSVYIVAYAGDSLTTNRACDDVTSTIVAEIGSSFPSYIFSLASEITSTSVVVCYIRSGATVAEVPQLLNLTPPNPIGYTTGVTIVGDDKLRQYIPVTFTGINLDSTMDLVVFSNSHCASSSTRPPPSATFIERIGNLFPTDGTEAGTSLTIIVQFIAESKVSVYVCYNRGGVWSEVGAPLQLGPPIPISLTLQPPIGVARAGQHIQIQLSGNDGMTIANAAAISSDNSISESWCHNFTAAGVREPLLNVVNSGLLDIPIWQNAGPARVCVQNTNMAWSDLAPTSIGSVTSVIINEANPSSMQPFPTPPRVGQEVTLTFQLIFTPNINDRVRIALPTPNEGCDEASSINGFENEIPIVINDETSKTSSVTLLDSTDALQYRSFNTTGSFKVCYYSAQETIWSVVGGTLTTGTLNIQPMAPEKWSVVGGEIPIFAEPFILQFDDTAGNLNATGDIVWAAPLTQSCGVTPEGCSRCIVFTLDTTSSSATTVITQSITSSIVGNFNLCYQLNGATAALLPQPLIINTGEIECLVQENIRIGQEQQVIFRKRDGVNVTGDSWRISFFGTSTSDCSSGYVSDFIEGRARFVSDTSITVTYAVEWPVSMVASQYLICYTHNNIARPVCTCGQIDLQTGECFVSTLVASPISFEPIPTPTYVGQTIQLRFTLDNAMSQYPLTQVKLVTYVDALTICNEDEAFPVTGGILTSESATSFVFKFKHNYALGASTLIVCTLSPLLSVNYARVGTITPATSSNTLILRPYLTLSTFPTDENLIRAMQTLDLTFTHVSNLEDDVVGTGDRITFVDSPGKCIESEIEIAEPASILALFMLEDTSFSTIPAPVFNLNSETRSSSVFVTFDSTLGLGNRYICYKLNTGTWAPVLSGINILASATTSCVRTPPTSSPTNGDDDSIRAMQYVKMIIIGTAETSTYRTPTDLIRVVPQTSPCRDDSAALFTSGVNIDNNVNTSLIAFTETSGTFKVCYIIGEINNPIANWSPACISLTVTNPSPSGDTVGCFRLGQTLSITTTHRAGFQFTNTDRFRFISGTDQCIYVNGTQTVSSTITVGDAAQTIDGTSVTSTTNSFIIPPTLLATGTTTIRLCYKDAVGNQFAVPLDTSNPTISQFTITPRLPASVMMQNRITAGQRVLMIFNAEEVNTENTKEEERQLTPFAAQIPTPIVPGPIYNGQFDAANAIALSASLAYREGRCYINQPAVYGVYGNNTQTFATFDPTTGGMHIPCYITKGCSVEDVGVPVRVGGYNPLSWNINPTPPRRGQLLNLQFNRNTEDSESVPLTPESDLALAQPDLISCWSLSSDNNNSGTIVSGTSEITLLSNVIFPAQSPTTAANSQLRACYHLTGGSWSEIPSGLITLLPANPVSFTVLNAPAREQQLNFIEFTGTGLSTGDHVKIIEKSTSCTDTSTPPVEIVSHRIDNGNSIVGSSQGWEVTNVTSTQSILNISTSITGNFSVCYKLATDTVWTLVYNDLTILSRDPADVIQTPLNVLEGELFTLEFIASELNPGLSENDRIALYTGNVLCISPGNNNDVIVTSPSRIDLLPKKLFFQLASGTRGIHTLCYWKGVGNVIVWGFETITINPNPSSYSTIPILSLLRSNQLINLIFSGFGLISEESGKTDSVKLIPSTSSQTDLSCQTEDSATGVVYYPLIANGTYSVQIIRSPPTSIGSYWICYKLNGGQYHIMEGNFIQLTAADPSGATSSKGNKILDGELITWTITTLTSLTDGAFVFYSKLLCNDFPYYEIPEISVENFPNGVANIQNGVALLRAGISTISNTSISLCYYSEGVITMLSESAITVTAGVPPALTNVIEVKALQIFKFSLSVTPTSEDYIILLSNPDQCVGVTKPTTSDDLFINTEFLNEVLTITTALGKEGTFYICYSHRIDRCTTGSTQDCARIVGTIIASKANPSGWSITPSTIYTTDTIQITLSRPSESETQTNMNLWLAPIVISTTTTTNTIKKSTRATATMNDVALACLADITSEGRIVLQSNPNETDVWTGQTNIVENYALCYVSDGNILPNIFAPLSRAGPIVHLTQVTSVMFSSPPTVGINNIIILYGHGLSQGDQLIAVGVPLSETLPSDICTNTNYNPRVIGLTSNTESGLTSMAWQLKFSIAMKYVLCFQAAASTGPMILITTDPIDVNPTLLSVNVVSVALTNTPLQLEFIGRGLTVSDLATIILTTGTEGNNICSTVNNYINVISASNDGTTSLFTTIPTQAGNYVVCYMRSGSTSVKLPNLITVNERTAVAAVFRTVPVCTALTACSPQPILALVNSAGEVTSDAFATVLLRIKLLNGDYVDQYLSGGTIYTQTDYSIFNFITVTISTVGQYTMEAIFSLRGGIELIATSPELTVSASNVQELLSIVTCEPIGIIRRSLLSTGERNPNVNISCIIAAKSPLAPTSYRVQINAGTATEIIPEENTEGLPRYRFTVIPPHEEPTIQFVSIITTASPPLESWPVQNSPVIVRIGSQPEPISTLSCISNSSNLPSPTMVRENNNLICNAQGKRMINNLELNIIALPEYIKIMRQINDDESTSSNINIGDYPISLDGNYIFNVQTISPSRYISILGMVPSSDGSTTFVPMKGSPSRFTVIGEPEQNSSSISCVSQKSSSSLWYTPVEPFTCTLNLGNGGQPINGIPQDFLVTMNQGGSIIPNENNSWGTTIIIHGAAPPIIENSLNQEFNLSITYIPLNRYIGTSTGTLVYINSVEISRGNSNNRMLLKLTGSGLNINHKYGVQSSTNCINGVENEAIVSAITGSSNSIQLDIQSREGPFYLCFAPSDQLTNWQTLSNNVLNYEGSSSGDSNGIDKWTILLIIGLIFLAILLALLIAMIWSLCLYKRREKVLETQNAIYLPPRVNDRFVSQPNLIRPPPVQNTTPSQAAALIPAVKSKQNGSRVRININDRNIYDADVHVKSNGNSKNFHPISDLPYSRQSEQFPHDPSALKLYDDLDTDSSTGDDIKKLHIPPLPPPLPPAPQNNDNLPPLIGTVNNETQNLLVNEGNIPRTGPYQHLHHYHQPSPLIPPIRVQSNRAEEQEQKKQEVEEQEPWVGPFIVKGHTSKPLVSSTHSSSGMGRSTGTDKKQN